MTVRRRHRSGDPRALCAKHAGIGVAVTVALLAFVLLGETLAPPPIAPARLPGLARVVDAATTNPGNTSNSSGTPADLTYTVSFLASGLPSGAEWTVLLGELSRTSFATTITFLDVPGGSVSFWVSAPAGYSASPASGTITLAQDYRQLVSFAATSAVGYTASWWPLPTVEIALLAGIGGVGGAAVALLEVRERRRRRPGTAARPGPSA
jgi:hypothetical protein